MTRKTCPTCESEYEITERKMIYRDKDTLDCFICGKELMSWNGAVSYSAKLIKKGAPKASTGSS